jgi:hypothetical protein
VYTFLHNIYLLSSSSYPSPFPVVAALPRGRACSALLFSDVVEEKREKKMKNMTFLLV